MTKIDWKRSREKDMLARGTVTAFDDLPPVGSWADQRRSNKIPTKVVTKNQATEKSKSKKTKKVNKARPSGARILQYQIEYILKRINSPNWTDRRQEDRQSLLKHLDLAIKTLSGIEPNHPLLGEAAAATARGSLEKNERGQACSDEKSFSLGPEKGRQPLIAPREMIDPARRSETKIKAVLNKMETLVAATKDHIWRKRQPQSRRQIVEELRALVLRAQKMTLLNRDIPILKAAVEQLQMLDRGGVNRPGF